MNSEKYEEIHNMILLFFVEKLVDKCQPRLIHNLSCQFGKKGFTKEVKQIAGNSQSYPFLFSIDDKSEQVSLI